MASLEAAHIVVCDAGPLIHLDELHSLDLLAGTAEILVPEIVWREVKQHRPSALRRRRVSLNRVDILPRASRALSAAIRSYVLDAGEAQALRLMQKFRDAILLTDDAAARLFAQELGYEVHGTIGVILQALPRGKRTKAQIINLLRAIPKRSSLFIRADLLDAVINKILTMPR
jgi:predicted nucleic acid-binding protein